MAASETPLPPGWDAERVRVVLEHYEARYERYVLEKIARGNAALADGRARAREEVTDRFGRSRSTPALPH